MGGVIASRSVQSPCLTYGPDVQVSELDSAQL
jgi:hypothetical protein